MTNRFFLSFFPTLAEMYVPKELDIACTYLPRATDTTLDSKDAWIYEVRHMADSPICPFLAWLGCNEAGSAKCQECQFAKEMYWYKLSHQHRLTEDSETFPDEDEAEYKWYGKEDYYPSC